MRLTLLVAAVFFALLLAGPAARADGLYSSTFSGTLVEIETADAFATPIGSSTTSARSAAFDVDGTLYTTVNSGRQLATFDLETGAVTIIGPLLSWGSMDAIEIDQDGVLHGITRTGWVYRIDKDSGRRRPSPTSGSGTCRTWPTIPTASCGACPTTGCTGSTWRRATPSLVGSIEGEEGFVYGIAFDADGRLWATTTVLDAPLYEIDLDTLAVRLVGYTGLDFPRGCDIYVPVVSEAPAPPPDADADGYPDDVDAFPNSDMRSTVWVGDRDSGVENLLFEDGATIAGSRAACAVGADRHGTFVSRVARLCIGLRKDGWITGAEQGAIQRAAAKHLR